MDPKTEKQTSDGSQDFERDPYENLYDREHPVSKRHPQMSALQRAAQFAPFAALVGYEDMIDDAGVKYRAHQDAEDADDDFMILADDGE